MEYRLVYSLIKTGGAVHSKPVKIGHASPKVEAWNSTGERNGSPEKPGSDQDDNTVSKDGDPQKVGIPDDPGKGPRDIWREKTSKVAQNEDGSIKTVKDIGNLKESDSSSLIQLEKDGDINVIKTTSQAQQEEITDMVKGNSEDGSGEIQCFVKDGRMPNPIFWQLEEGEIDAGLNEAGASFSTPKSMEKDFRNEVVNCMCSQSEENVKSTYPAEERSPLSQNFLEEKRSDSGGGSGPLKPRKVNHLPTQEAVRGEALFIQVEK
ncbi:hypothetical protein SUGI_0044880 [Cryptomeria japonica]|nr:hypothetical protein SUGI_0044880 [Cryptomeria japonica]